MIKSNCSEKSVLIHKILSNEFLIYVTLFTPGINMRLGRSWWATTPVHTLSSDVITAYVISARKPKGPAHIYHISLSPDKPQICLHGQAQAS